MLIDCATCVARDSACGDCIVTVLLARPPLRADRRTDGDPAIEPAIDPLIAGQNLPVDLDQDERDAIATLAGAGLVPPLRLVRAMPDSSGNIRYSA